MKVYRQPSFVNYGLLVTTKLLFLTVLPILILSGCGPAPIEVKRDEVAYVRFASVYKQSKEINEFMAELEGILKSRRAEKNHTG